MVGELYVLCPGEYMDKSALGEFAIYLIFAPLKKKTIPWPLKLLKSQHKLLGIFRPGI